MNFDPDPRSEVALGGADIVCTDVLPSLRTDAGSFFGDAYRALGAGRLLTEDSVEVAARVAMRLAAASGSLAVAFASGFGFARASRLGGAPVATGPLGVAAQPLGVVALGGSVTANDGRTSVLRGECPFVIGGTVATHAVVVSDTDPSSPAVVHVDLAGSGVSRKPVFSTLGFDGVPVCALQFDDVTVEPHMLVAAGSSAAAPIRFTRSMRRILDGAIAVGIGRHAFRTAAEHLRSLGRRPSQSTEFSLSDVATELDAGELSVLRAAWALDRNSGRALEGASAKLLAARAATRAAHTALVLAGASGCTSDLGQCYLEACALEFHDETSAEQVETIASEMLEES